MFEVKEGFKNPNVEEEKLCANCRWSEIDNFEEPCVHCGLGGNDGGNLWEPRRETVEHPEHYKTGKIECIDAMVEIYGAEATKDFCLLNAFKYLWRCKHKGKEKEDIQKAKFYLEKFLEL